MSDENNNESKKEAFPLEKILTMSAKDYCSLKSTKLKDYNAVGVHVDDGSYKLIENFGEIVPITAEVVVDFQYMAGGAEYYASGTALIRKDKNNSEN